jgi:hypothetical protein
MRIGIGRIKNEISPIHKLPHDLLQEVFRYTCWSGQHKAPHSVVTLSHVCCLWRVILLSTPQFWRAVTVDGRDPSFAAACLVRSGRLPLDVTLQFNDTATPDEDDSGAEFSFSLLEREDVRWRLDECREGLTLLEAERDRIHRLYINCISLGSNRFDYLVPEHGFFGCAPKNLQELWWYHYDGQGLCPLPFQLFDGSFESLRHLRLENVEVFVKRIPNLTSLEYINSGGPDRAIPVGMQEFFRRSPSLRSLKIVGWEIYEEYIPRTYMANLTSLTLEGVLNWYLFPELLMIKNLDRGTFTTISFSDENGITFSAVNSVGFSLTATILPDEDPEEDDFMRSYFSEATLVRLEDFQIISDTKRLFSILRILGDSEGDMGRLELYVETEYLNTDVEVAIFAEPFLPRLGTLAIYLPEWLAPEEWVEMMVDDLFRSCHNARFSDECAVEVYHSASGFSLLTNMGELRADFEDGGS